MTVPSSEHLTVFQQGHLQRDLINNRHSAALLLREGNLVPPVFRELRAQLNEATSRADAERQTRQELETKLAQYQQRADAAESQLREALKSTDGSNEAILRALRTELKSQEAEIAQARKIQSRVKCALNARLTV